MIAAQCPHHGSESGPSRPCPASQNGAHRWHPYLPASAHRGLAIVQSVVTRPVYVRILRTLVAAAEKQNDRLAGSRLVHAIARPHINAKLPNAFTTRLVIAEIALLNAVDAPHDSRFGLRVTHRPEPFGINILVVAAGDVMLVM